MIEHSPYLDLPLRSLRDLADEIRDKVVALEIERSSGDAVSWDTIDKQLHPLYDRLEEIEDEIAWAERGGDARDEP